MNPFVAQPSDLVGPVARERGLSRHVGLVALEGGPVGPVAELGRAVEAEVFGAEFGNSPEDLDREYAPYASASRFIVVGDVRAGRPVGVMRLIFPSVGGLKSVNDLEAHVGVSPAAFLARENLDGFVGCLDLATLAVVPAYRRGIGGHRVSALLYRTLMLIAARGDVRLLVAIIDDTALRTIRFIEPRLRPISGTSPFPYLGSPRSHAVVVSGGDAFTGVRDRADVLRRRARPRLSDLWCPRGLLERQIVARGVEAIATGRGLDDRIRLETLASDR